MHVNQSNITDLSMIGGGNFVNQSMIDQNESILRDKLTSELKQKYSNDFSRLEQDAKTGIMKREQAIAKLKKEKEKLLQDYNLKVKELNSKLQVLED